MAPAHDDLIPLILQKLDKIEEKQDVHAVAQAEIKADLREHMRRTSILEEVVKPIQKHVALVAAIAKILGFLGGGVGVAVGLMELYSFFAK